jgi:hypothetical protein
MTAARVFQIGMGVLQLLGTLLMLDRFIGMAERGVRGEGLVLPNEVAQAQRLATAAASWRDESADFSTRLQNESFRLLAAAGDATTAGRTSGQLSSVVVQLVDSRRELPAQTQRLSSALAEVRAKRAAAEGILNSGSASGALPAATFGTAALAELFAASVDLSRIEGSLNSALTALRTVDRTVAEDIAFGTSWSDSLFDVCRRGGACGQRTFTIPFVGTSTVRFLPGEDQS